ncbi:tail length tape measure protein [Streptomyces phage KimJongPhill]|uniref:Tape measure protein n=1 Tax=Streptomyces phage KimJongPhill TaxID=2848886 RepID=A0A8F2E6R0_9CAUD|nr:tail length tape measure protein [Streptomyces phage KimJongPhill]QWT29806.1 tape measure protein [Streptomyces phage KimJongPhill]
MAVTIATGVVTVQPDIDESGVVRAANQVGQRTGDAFVRGMDGRLRDVRGRFVSQSRALGGAMNDAGNRTNSFSRNVRGLTGVFATVGRAIGTAAMQFGKFGLMAGGAIPAIAGIITALQNIAPAAAGAVTAVFAFAQGMAAIKIGTSGIGDAVKAAFAPTASAASSATSAANNHAKAMQGVQDATESAARANADAAKRVKEAEQNLVDAQKEAIAVQKELSQAREDAKRELEDLNSALAHGELDLKQAQQDLADAEQDYRDKTAINSTATKKEQEEALLRLQEAQLALKDQQTETKRLREDTAKANKEGIDGTQAMTQWKDKNAQANKNVADQEKALAEARQQQAQTAADGQKQVAAAMESLNTATEKAAAGSNALGNAMAKLSPNARAFVNEIIRLKPAWDNLKLDVQDALFAGLADRLRTMAASVLPVLRTNLTNTAGILNQMAKGAMDAATQVGADGTLGKAMAGANAGMANLIPLPGKILTAITQLGAAGSPVFESLTAGIADKVTAITDKLGTAFKSGALTDSITMAMGLIKDLGAVFMNVFEIIGNIFGQFQEEGGGMINVLKTITDALVGFTATKGFQDAMSSLASVFNTFATTAAPLLGTVLEAIEPIITALAPPLNILIKALGDALTPIIKALGPVLAVAAQAIGNLVVAFAPILPVLGDLIASLLPPLMPLFQALADAFVQFGPLVQQVGKMLQSLLVPILDQLGPILQPLIEHFTTMTEILFPILSQLLLALAPSIASLGQTFGQLLVALSPLITVLAQLLGGVLTAMAPLLIPIIELVGKLATILADQLANVITNVIIPVIQTLAAVFSGDFAGAWEGLKSVFVGVWDYLTGTFSAIGDVIGAIIDTIVDIFKYLYDVLIGHSIIPDLVNGIIGWFTGMGKTAAKLFQNMWDWVVGKVTGMKNDVVDKVTSMKNSVVNVVTSIRDRINGIMGTARDWVVGKARDLRDKVVGAFNTFRDKSVAAFNAAKDGIKTAWDKIKGIAKAPVQFVIDTVYNNGIRKVWNAVVGAFGGKKLGEVKGFAGGGILPGHSTYRQGDDQLVPMRKGEGVYVSEAMKDPYERARLYAVNKAAMSGQPLDKFQGSGSTRGPAGFALGGIFDGIGDVASGAWDKVKSGYSWLKDTFGGAIRAGVKTVVNPLINKIPGKSGFSGMLKDTAHSLVDRLIGAGDKGNKEGGFAPSKGVAGALKWAKSQAGKPYQWGGAFNPSFDCSGFMSSISKVIEGLNPKGRLWSTHSFSGSTAPKGWGYHLNSPFKIGITNAGVGHTAGTLAGTNVESRGGDGVVVGSRARGYNNSMFGSWYGFKPARAGAATGGIIDAPWVSRDMGGILPDGVGALNTSGTAEVVSTLDQLKALVAAGKGQTYIFNEGSIVLDASKIKSIQDVVDMIDALKVTSRQHGARV